MDTSTDRGPSSSPRLDLIQTVLSKLLEITDKTLVSALCLAAVGSLGEIFKSGSIPIPNDSIPISDDSIPIPDDSSPEEAMVKVESVTELSKASLVRCLTKKLKNAKDSKVREV